MEGSWRKIIWLRRREEKKRGELSVCLRKAALRGYEKNREGGEKRGVVRN